MKTSYFFSVVSFLILSASLSASDISLGTFSCAGRTYANAKVLKKDAHNVTIIHESGTTKLDLLALPKNVAAKINFDPAKVNVADIKSAQKRQAEEDAQNQKLAEQRTQETLEADRKAGLDMVAATERVEKSRQAEAPVGTTSTLSQTAAAPGTRVATALATGEKKVVSKVRSGRRRSSYGGGRGGGGGGGGSC
jgi:hypothetical protein